MKLNEVASKINIDRYLHGYCYTFAVALHKALGFPMQILWDFEYDSGPSMVHAYAVRPDGSFVDAAGTVEDWELKSEFSEFTVTEYEFQTIKNEVTMRKIVEKHDLENYTSDEINRLVTFILKNTAVYKQGIESFERD